jgi:hypothetical protein
MNQTIEYKYSFSGTCLPQAGRTLVQWILFGT